MLIYIYDMQITECRYIKVKFESKVTWRLNVDRLRCSPSFYGSPRYDSAIMQWRGEDGSLTQSVCQLIRTFAYEIGGRKYGLALVQPFDRPTPSRLEDRELGLCLYSISRCTTADFLQQKPWVRQASSSQSQALRMKSATVEASAPLRT